MREIIEDIPVIGSALAAGAAIVDVIVYGGSQFVDVALASVWSADLLVPLLVTLERLGQRVPVIPGDLGPLITLALAALVSVYAVRLINRVRDS